MDVTPGEEKSNSRLIAIGIIVGLLVIIALLLWWGIYNYQQNLSRSLNVIQNPYCPRVVCPNESCDQDPVLVTLNGIEDPQRTTYQTLNWCLVNYMFYTNTN